MAEPSFLLDANICIFILQGTSDRAARRISRCPVGQLVTSSIVFAEVMFGARKHDRAGQALAFFDQVPVLPFDAAAADAYSRLPFKRGSYDRLIAAHALSLGLPVVTGNERDFDDVPGLKVENWAEP